MASKIHWTDETWNPSVGCTRVSSGCDHCYAFALHDRRYAANKAVADDHPIADRRRGLSLPFPKQYDLPFSKVQLLPDRLDAPLHWRKPRRVFVDSMSDLFHEEVPDEFIDRVFAVMAAAPQHTFQVLTKRPDRMRTYSGSLAGSANIHRDRVHAAYGFDAALQFEQGLCGSRPYPLPNVWLGVSVENQETADERIPLLLKVPAAVRWISAEPLLGPVDLERWCDRKGSSPECAICRRTKSPLGRSVPTGLVGSMCDRDCSGYNEDPRPDQLWAGESAQEFHYTGEAFLDWLIVGGETGQGYRPMNLDWARALRDQCQAAGVPLFYKQGSGPRPGMHRELDGLLWEEFPDGA